MKVADLMSRGIEFAEPSMTIQAVAELMGELDVGALPVGDPFHLEGVITDRDILFRVVSLGLDPTATKVRSVVSSPVITCLEDDSIQAAMDLMAANHIRRLPVTGSGGSVVGWVTLADFARRMLVENTPLQTALQELTEVAP